MCDSLVSREGNPLGGREVLAAETEGWTDDKSQLFPFGQCTDCNQDFAPDKMPPLCSASWVFIHVIAVRHFTVFSQHMARCSPAAPRAACRQTCAEVPSAHTPCLSSVCCSSLAGHARNTDTLPALSATGAGALALRSHSHQ